MNNTAKRTVNEGLLHFKYFSASSHEFGNAKIIINEIDISHMLNSDPVPNWSIELPSAIGANVV